MTSAMPRRGGAKRTRPTSPGVGRALSNPASTSPSLGRVPSDPASPSPVGGRVVSAQGDDVLPVDEDGTAGFFAGAGQADADACRLRLARAVDDAAHDGEGHLFDAFVRLLPFGHLVADVALDPLGELLKRAARRPAA